MIAITTKPLQPTTSAHHRFHLLDGLRGVAAILVLYWHAPAFLWASRGHSNYLAVDFFFCLSGFVVSFAYERRLRESLSFGRFISARLVRLYPLYLLAALIGLPAFFLAGVPHPLPHTLLRPLLLLVPLQLLMVPNFGNYPDVLLFPVLNPGWSLFFEVVASLGFGALVRFRLDATRYLVVIYVVAIASMTYWSHVHHDVSVGWESSLKAFCAGNARIALSFLAGVLVQRIYRTLPKDKLTRTAGALLALGITCILPLLLLTPLPAMRTAAYQVLLLAFGFPGLVLLAAYCRPQATWSALCSFLGDISYPLYLFHYPCLTLLALPSIKHLLMPHRTLRPFVLPFILCALAALSYAVSRFYDIPVRQRLTRLLNSRSTAGPFPSQVAVRAS